MLCFLVTLLIWNLLSVPVITKDVTHVGCFNTSTFASSDHGTVVKPLSWEICIQLCLNKLTMYAGVQLRRNTCYCWNDMYQQSAEVDLSYCQPCYEDTAKWCGGHDSLSLYQLKPKGSSQLAILLATDSGITKVIIDNNSNSSETLKLSEASATSVAYHYRNQDIYFISKNKIFKLSYKPLLMEYIHPLPIIDDDCNDRPDLDVDWERNLIYWACANSSEIKKSDLDGTNQGRIIYNADGLKYVAVEPYTRLILFIMGMSLNKYDFSIFTLNILRKEYSFEKVFQLTIDIQQEVIYAIGSYDDVKKTRLVSLNYDCTVFKVLYQGEELSNTVGLDAFNGTIIWARVENENYIIYRGVITMKGHLKKVIVIHTGNQKVNDLRIYHPEAQSPSTDYLCRKKNCSHSCTVITSALVQCTCPTSSRENFTTVLANDSKTCIDIPTHKMQPQTTEWITSTSESVTLESESSSEMVTSESSLTEDLQSSTGYSPDYTIGNEESEAWSETEISVGSTTKTPVLSGQYILKSTQPSRLMPNHESASHLLLLSILSCSLILILVVIIPFQVYLAIWLKRTNRTFGPLILYHRPSELVELT